MKGIKSYIITGILFVSIVGTLFHFAYEWSGNNILIGLFTPINESIWEHTKLIFFPILIYSCYLNKKLHVEYPCIKSATILSSLLGIALIIILFYTYSGIIGFHIAFVDIVIFYISVIMSFYFIYKLTLYHKLCNFSNVLQFAKIIIICLFFIFTFFPPNIPLFINP